MSPIAAFKSTIEIMSSQSYTKSYSPQNQCSGCTVPSENVLASGSTNHGLAISQASIRVHFPSLTLGCTSVHSYGKPSGGGHSPRTPFRKPCNFGPPLELRQLVTSSIWKSIVLCTMRLIKSMSKSSPLPTDMGLSSNSSICDCITIGKCTLARDRVHSRKSSISDSPFIGVIVGPLYKSF